MSDQSNKVIKRDIVFIDRLEIEASIGVYDWEKEIKQRLLVTIDLETDFSLAACSDEVSDAISYADVAQLIDDLVREQHHNLLEHLAARLSDALFDRFMIFKMRLKIEKPGAVMRTQSVGVEIYREVVT